MYYIRYTVAIQHPVRLIVDWFFRRCIYYIRIYLYAYFYSRFDRTGGVMVKQMYSPRVSIEH